MTSPKLDLKSILGTAESELTKIKPYSFVVFLIFIAVIYGFVLIKINSLRSVEPSAEAVSSQVKAAQIPYIDPEVVKQLESLQDNSVSVKALFDQARSNPF